MRSIEKNDFPDIGNFIADLKYFIKLRLVFGKYDRPNRND